VNFWLIVAAEPSNASEKLLSEASASARDASAGASAASADAPEETPKAPKLHFFLAMKKI
jgi:hypothetical protein